jgi:HrpA-like RNA helicase
MSQVCQSLCSLTTVFNLQMHYLEESASDYVRSAVDTAVSIHRDGMPGDILLLLPGRLQTCDLRWSTCALA